jgi:hypothetical protein
MQVNGTTHEQYIVRWNEKDDECVPQRTHVQHSFHYVNLIRANYCGFPFISFKMKIIIVTLSYAGECYRVCK